MDRPNIKTPTYLLQTALLGISLAIFIPQPVEASISQYSTYNATIDMYDNIQSKDSQSTEVFGSIIGGLTILSYGACAYIGKKRESNLDK